MKAFLSHSSRDKEFVRAVSKELKRQYCAFDERDFVTGNDFFASIREHLKESDIFVLFASRNSLASDWVAMEVEEASYERLKGNITKCLVYIIDSGVTSADLPSWLQRAKISPANSPKAVARQILSHIDEVLRHKHSSLFLGRRRDIEELQQLILPVAADPPAVLVVSGLPGIGRRSLVRNVSRSLFNIDRMIDIAIQEGDSIEDLAIKLAAYVAPFSTKLGFDALVVEIKALSEGEQLERIIRDLHVFQNNREMPLLYDEGGLLNFDGHFSDAVNRIITSLPQEGGTLLCVVTRRKPITELGGVILNSINRLDADETKLLLTALARRSDLRLSPQQLSEIAEYTTGVPPACYFAIQFAASYGIHALIEDKARLVDFRTTPFISHLAASRLQSGEAVILKLLAEYSPLPLAVIGSVSGLSASNLIERLITLIDFSFVTTDRLGLYWIADPIRDAVLKIEGIAAKSFHENVVTALAEFMSSSAEEEPRFELTRVLFRAASIAGRAEISKTCFHLAADVIRNAANQYYARNFQAAIRFAKEAVELRPKSEEARSFLIRSYIQEDLIEDATEELERFRSFAPLRDYYYLRGFLDRKRGNMADAIRFFELAEKAGRRGTAIKRELAACYFIMGDVERAASTLSEVLNSNLDNRFIVDLSVQIAVSQENEPLARQRLALLKAVDAPEFYLHRVSNVELTFGNTRPALEAAQAAVEAEKVPSYEVSAQLIVCQIKEGLFSDAERSLERLAELFPRKRIGLQKALWALLENARGRFAMALAILEEHPDKQDDFYLDQRLVALKGELVVSALPDAVRISYSDEIVKLERRVTKITLERFGIMARR